MPIKFKHIIWSKKRKD